MSHDMPNIVADNHFVQVISASLEYREDPTLSNQSFLDFGTGHTYWV